MPAPATTTDEKRALIEAGLVVLRRSGSDGCTVADVLSEAGLSTRAFYRHFASKDAAHSRDLRAGRGGEPCAARVATGRGTVGPAPRSRSGSTRRSRSRSTPRRARAHPSAREGRAAPAGRVPGRVRRDRRAAASIRSLTALRRAGSPDPERDARSIHAITWELVTEKLAGGSTHARRRAGARVAVLRPAVGAPSERAPARRSGVLRARDRDDAARAARGAAARAAARV